jgi:hypothetical protein
LYLKTLGAPETLMGAAMLVRASSGIGGRIDDQFQVEQQLACQNLLTSTHLA